MKVFKFYVCVLPFEKSAIPTGLKINCIKLTLQFEALPVYGIDLVLKHIQFCFKFER